MSLIKHYSILEDELKSKPFEEGALYVTIDTNRIFADLVGGGSHTLISASPIILSTEEERENLLAPIHNTIYFVSSTSKLYVNNNGNWLVASYSHPSYTSHQSDLYKISVDGSGHVNGATAVSKEDITKLGIPGQDTTYDIATSSKNGLMSSSMVSKLEGIDTGANKTTVDSTLSSTSTNPVQNKIVNSAITNLNNLVGTTTVKTQIENAIVDHVTIDFDNANEGEANPINADTLGGYITADDINRKLSMELLWENASPTSVFEEQTINVGLKNYSSYIIVARATVGADIHFSTLVPVGVNTHLVFNAQQTLNKASRNITYTNGNLLIGKAYLVLGSTNASEEGNIWCIPTHIYGIKGVSA